MQVSNYSMQTRTARPPSPGRRQYFAVLWVLRHGSASAYLRALSGFVRPRKAVDVAHRLDAFAIFPELLLSPVCRCPVAHHEVANEFQSEFPQTWAGQGSVGADQAAFGIDQNEAGITGDAAF